MGLVWFLQAHQRAQGPFIKTVSKSHLISGTSNIFMARVVIYGLSIRTDRTDRQQGYTVCKECFTVRKSHFISGTQNIFIARVVIYGSSIRTDRKSSIGSVKNFLRSVNCISLVGLRRERRHCLSIQRDNTNCKSLILKRCSRFIAEFFFAKLFRARTALSGSTLGRRRTKTSSPSLSEQGIKIAPSRWR